MAARRTPYPLATERLLLRPFTDADADALFAIYGPPDVSRYLYTEPRTRDEIPEMLERAKQLTAIDDEHDGLRLAAVLRESGEVVGDISLWRVSREHQQGEVGYVLVPAHQGHGYATEAVREMLRLGFEEVGFHRIVGRLDARNASSAAVLERAGMRREAHLRENEFIKGEWADELIYAMLASEWDARGERAT
jgi:RimJ/RimL family protein N-acetyltransferase